MPSKKTNLVKKETIEPPSIIEPVQVIEPVELVQSVVEVKPTQKGGKKKETPATATKKETPVTATSPKKGKKETKETSISETPKVNKKGGSKKKDIVSEKEGTIDEEDILVNGRKLRSFKVKLPNSEDYEGRFTGLTPYQAANKALSKFFRQNKDSITDISNEVEFSINETTRNSKKTIYTYIGTRNKLEVPVVYKIKDSKDGSIREIVKNFKNSVKKVKKNDKV
jgi:hypothetical protein